jgi:hypothetical protein
MSWERIAETAATHASDPGGGEEPDRVREELAFGGKRYGMKVSWVSSIPDRHLRIEAAGNARLAGGSPDCTSSPLGEAGGVWYELVGNAGRSALSRDYRDQGHHL